MVGNELDLYLSIGYFRMQQDVFTCQYIIFDNEFCPTHWLRIVLDNVTLGPKQRRLLRINEGFTVTIKPFLLTDEIETLYAKYRESIQFDAPESVESFLFNGATYNLFDTYIVEVRAGEQLIAGGVFDNGTRSIAGIMNFYDPAYRKHSLGKYLMLLKMNYAQQQCKTYYYPGYIVSHYPKFDYKLFACESATEVYDSYSGIWLPFSWDAVGRLAARIEDNYLGFSDD